MDIKLVNYYLFSVPVSFEISKIHIPYSRHILIELEVDGKRGIGEGISYKSSLSQIERYLQDIDFNSLYLKKIISKEPGLATAIDQAILDAQGAFGNLKIPEYTRQVFIQPVERMMEDIELLIKNNCRKIKIKLGRNAENDKQLIKIIQNKYSHVQFNADVNCGYDYYNFEEVLKVNKDFIKVWEEPVKKQDQKKLVQLKEKYKIRTMFDESVKTINDLKYYINEKIIDILNIKLSRVGGITKAIEYVELCKKNGIGVSVGCSEELGIGMKAIDYLTSKIPEVVGVEGEGKERLGFDVLNNDYKFDEEKLIQAAKKNHFMVFSKNKKMTKFDQYFEFSKNLNAKFHNLKILLCR